MGKTSPQESSMVIPQPANFAAMSFFRIMSRLSRGAFGMISLILSLLYRIPVVPHIHGTAYWLPGSTDFNCCMICGSALRAFGMLAWSSFFQKPFGISRASSEGFLEETRPGEHSE